MPVTSFVVALSYEHMAFRVFVHASHSDPCIFCGVHVKTEMKAARVCFKIKILK